MSRNAALMLIGALAPVTGACSAVTPAPMVVARLEAAVPPVPAELLAATNGKADPPFQIEAALVLAAQMVRETAAPARAASPAPVELARATPAPALPVQLARAAPPRAPAAPVAAPVAALGPAAPATPSAPIRYAELAKLDEAAAASAATPAPVLAATAPRRMATPSRASPPAIRFAAAFAAAKPVSTTAATPRPSFRADALARPAPRRSSPVDRQQAAITRIRTLITGWLKAIRI